MSNRCTVHRAVTFCKVLGDAKYLCDVLQSSALDQARAVYLVSALIDTFQAYRTENYFGEQWKKVEDLAEQCKISLQPQPQRHPRISSRFLDSLVMTTVGQRNYDDEGFPKSLFFLS